MKRKDLAVGKYVTLNRWLNKCGNLYYETLEIISTPDTKEENVVGCRRVTNNGCICTGNKYANETITYINYIHLKEVDVDPYACLKWKEGDVLVPTEHEKFFNPRLASHTPYYINRIDRLGGYLKICICSCDGFINYDYIANPLFFKKDGSVSIWNGLFASQYYKKEIKFDDNGELVKPNSVVKGSPVYNQILKEAKACGIIKE